MIPKLINISHRQTVGDSPSPRMLKEFFDFRNFSHVRLESLVKKSQFLVDIRGCLVALLKKGFNASVYLCERLAKLM